MASSEIVVYDGPELNDGISDNEQKSSKKYVGLVNQGATCYMNSLLQALYMTPEFRSALYKWSYSEDKDGKAEASIPLHLQKLFCNLQLSKKTSVDTVSLTKSFGWDSTEVFQQQDVQELSRVLFDVLEQAFKVQEKSNDGSEKQQDLSSDFINQLYGGELISYIHCLGVDYKSERKDTFLDLSLAIAPPEEPTNCPNKQISTLHQCVELYLKPEILNGDNQYYVESLQKKVDAIKGLKFTKLPKILSIQLKRFVYDFRNPYAINQIKLNNQVKFPFYLDMNGYVAQEDTLTATVVVENSFEAFLQHQLTLLNATTVNDETKLPDERSICIEGSVDEVKKLEEFEDFSSIQSKEDLQKYVDTAGGLWVYELYAVLVHSGACGGGHYYTYIKDLESMQWYQFNDSHVSPVTIATVREAWGSSMQHTTPTGYSVGSSWGSSGSFRSSNAYLLLYRKIDIEIDVSGRRKVKYPEYPRDECIPEYLRSVIAREDAERAEREKIERDRFLRTTMNIFYDGALQLNEYTGNVSKSARGFQMHCSRHDSYDQSLRNIFISFGIAALTPIKVPEGYTVNDIYMLTGLYKDLIRLRKCTAHGLPRQPIDFIRYNNASITDLAICNMSYLEIRQLKSNIADRLFNSNVIVEYLQVPDNDLEGKLQKRALLLHEIDAFYEPFEEFIEDGYSLNFIVYNSATDAFLPVIQMRVPMAISLLSLKQILLANPSISNVVGNVTSDLRLFRIFSYNSTSQTDLPTYMSYDDDERIINTYHLSDSLNIYVEKGSGYIHNSLAIKRYMYEANNMVLQFNYPPSKDVSKCVINFDRRKTLGELRVAIAEKLNMEANNSADCNAFRVVDPMKDFRIYSSVTAIIELKDNDSKLMLMSGVYSTYGISTVYVEPVGEVPIGHSVVNLYLFHSEIYKCGVRNGSLLSGKRVDQSDTRFLIVKDNSGSSGGSPSVNIDDDMDLYSTPTGVESATGTSPVQAVEMSEEDAKAIAAALNEDDFTSAPRNSFNKMSRKRCDDSDADDMEVCVDSDENPDYQIYPERVSENIPAFNADSTAAREQRAGYMRMSSGESPDNSYTVWHEDDDEKDLVVSSYANKKTSDDFSAFIDSNAQTSNFLPVTNDPSPIDLTLEDEVNDISYVGAKVPVCFTDCNFLSVSSKSPKSSTDSDDELAIPKKFVPTKVNGISTELITLTQGMLLSEAKLKILNVLKRLKVIPMHATTQHIRLRDCNTFSAYGKPDCYFLGKIWRDESKSLLENGIRLDDNDIVIQVVEADETSNDKEVYSSKNFSDSIIHMIPKCVENLTIYAPESVIFMIARFSRKNRNIGKLFDFCVDMNSQLCHVMEMLAQYSGIDINHLRVMAVGASYSAINVTVADICNNLSSPEWCQCPKSNKKISTNPFDIDEDEIVYSSVTNDTSAAIWYRSMKQVCYGARDGYMLLFEDSSEVLRPLTKAELSAFEANMRVSSQSSSDSEWMYASSSGKYDSVASSSSTSSTSDGRFSSTNFPRAYARPAQKGIKIKSVADRDRELKNSESSGSIVSQGGTKSSIEEVD